MYILYMHIYKIIADAMPQKANFQKKTKRAQNITFGTFRADDTVGVILKRKESDWDKKLFFISQALLVWRKKRGLGDILRCTCLMYIVQRNLYMF